MTTLIQRRRFLAGLAGSLLAAPFVVRSGVLMPVREVGIWHRGELTTEIDFETNAIITKWQIRRPVPVGLGFVIPRSMQANLDPKAMDRHRAKMLAQLRRAVEQSPCLA